MVEIDLAGHTALVTGSSGGIGAAIALRLAEAGAAVIVHYRRDAAGAEETCAQISSSGGCAHLALGDARCLCGPERPWAGSVRGCGLGFSTWY